MKKLKLNWIECSSIVVLIGIISLIVYNIFSSSFRGYLYDAIKVNASLDLFTVPYDEETNPLFPEKMGKQGTYTLSYTKDNQYPIYYYRGDVTNNHVLFAGFCWYIVRTTETGGIKLLYNGTPNKDGSCKTDNEDSYLGITRYYDDTETKEDWYVSERGDSLVKQKIDGWYEKNLISYTEYLEDTPWCEDNEISTTDPKYYLTYIRLQKQVPNLSCDKKENRYTVDSKNGNGKLTYPIGMLTADELILAGFRMAQEDKLYFCSSQSDTNYSEHNYAWWTMSNGDTNLMHLRVTKSCWSFSVSVSRHEADVRPAISLKHETTYTKGDGSSKNPYVVKTTKK